MMSEEHCENGRINQDGEEMLEEKSEKDVSQHDDAFPSPGINSPRRHLPIESLSEEREKEESTMEFFDRKRQDSEGEGGGGRSEGDSSPPNQRRDKDTDSYHSRTFAMISPPLSPDVAASSASADLFGEDEDDSQSDRLRNLGIEDSDEVVKSKPVTWSDVPQGLQNERSRGEGRGGSAAASRLLLLQEKCEDLQVSIVTREKVEEKESYIRYKIHTKSSRLEKSEYEVWRRYRDFEWLREVTGKTHRTLIVPPLPGKQLTRYFDQKSEAFLEERQHALNKFLQRMCVHPYFSFDRHIEVFLTADPEEFAAYVTDMSGSSRLLGAVTSTVKMAANSMRLRNPDPEYAKAAKYFEDLGGKLSVVERIAARIHTEREELSSDMDNFAAATLQWSLNERDLVGPIQQTGACVENCSKALNLLNENNAYSLLMTAKEYQLYCSSGVSAVRHRDGLQLNKDKSTDDREKKKKVHDEAANTGKLQKLPKLADDLQKVGIEAERSLDELSVANEKLRVDIEKWTEAKNKEIKELMAHYADNHVNYHQKCFSEWEKVLSILRPPISSSSSSSSSIPMPMTLDTALSQIAGGVYTNNAPPPPGPGCVVGDDEGTPPRTLAASEGSMQSESPDLFS